MNIAIFTDTFLPQTNGVVTATIDLAKGLSKNGNKIIIFAPKYNTKKEFKYKNVKVIRESGIPALFYEDFKLVIPNFLKIQSIIKKEKIEIIHFQTPISLGMQAIMIAKLNNLPLVGTFHTFFADPEYLKHIKINIKPIQDIAWTFSNMFYNRCNLVTCPSEHAKTELLKNNCRKEIKVISNGIDFEKFRIINKKIIENTRKKYNEKGPLLLYVGRIAHEKNMIFLIECIKDVIKKEINAKLLIVGGGPQLNMLKEKIKEQNIEKNIILTGKIEHEKLIKSGIYAACDIFVTASETETQGITVLEAQINGLVTVGIDKKGVSELIKNNKNGFLIKSKDKKGFVDAVLKLIRNQKKYHELKKGTLIEIKVHELSSVIKIWEEEYKKLINKYNLTK
jgi:1,2-diacylglycerol 3-alpha-glucosyltransferase